MEAVQRVKLYEAYEHDENYNKFVVEDAYYDELVNYIHVIEGSEAPRHTFEKDKEILSLIDEIEE